MSQYALVIDNTIEAVQGRLPRGADADGQWIEPVTEQNAASCGWLPVVDVPRPADTDTDTHDRTVELVNGTPTVVWTARPWTPDELLSRARQTTSDTLTDLQAINAKLTEIKGFLLDPDIEASLNRTNSVAPTAAELNRTLKALIRQARRSANLDVRALRYVFGQIHPELLDDIADV